MIFIPTNTISEVSTIFTQKYQGILGCVLDTYLAYRDLSTGVKENLSYTDHAKKHTWGSSILPNVLSKHEPHYYESGRADLTRTITKSTLLFRGEYYIIMP